MSDDLHHALLRGWDELTPTDFRILEFAATGMTNVEIGQKFGVGLSAMKWHRGRLLLKIGARNMTHAVSLAHRAGMIR